MATLHYCIVGYFDGRKFSSILPSVASAKDIRCGSHYKHYNRTTNFLPDENLVTLN